MEIRELLGRAVVSVADGEKLGAVDEIMLDSEERRVGALRLNQGGMFNRQHPYVPFGAIESIGADAIMVADKNVVTEAPGPRTGGYHTHKQITDVRVVTDAGADLGNVSTAHFDPVSGSLTSFDVIPGGAGRRSQEVTEVSTENVLSIGEDIMVVRAAIA